MALKKEAITKMATLLKIKETDLEAALKDEKEVDLTIEPTLATFTETEVSTLKDNEYKKGKTNGVEMAVKDFKEKQGIDFQGKTIDGLVEAVSKKVLADAKIEPNQKITELEGKLKTVQTNYGDLEKKITEKDKEVAGIKINTELAKHIPTGATLASDKIIGLMRMDGYDFKLEEGKTTVYKDGTLMTDKISNAMLPKDVVASYVTENKLAPAATGGEGGRGGGNSNGAGKMTKLSELTAKYKAEGKSEMSQEFQAEATKLKTEDPTFDLTT